MPANSVWKHGFGTKVLTTALCTIVGLELEVPPPVANVRYLDGGDQPPAPHHRALVSVCARTRHRDPVGDESRRVVCQGLRPPLPGVTNYDTDHIASGFVPTSHVSASIPMENP